MTYCDMFSFQWDRLINDFIADHEKKAPETMTVSTLNEWFRLNSYRWSSFSEKEGILLSEEKNSQLSGELLAHISKFRFTPLPMGKKPAPWLGLLVAAAAAVGLGVVLYMHLTKLRVLWIILETSWCLSLGLGVYAFRMDKYNKVESKKIHSGYAKQLRDYKEVLMEICRQHA